MSMQPKLALIELVQEDDQATLSELAAGKENILGSRWEKYEISRALSELGYVHNKVFTRAYEANPDDQAAYRVLVQTCGYKAEQYVFFNGVATVGTLANDTL